MSCKKTYSVDVFSLTDAPFSTSSLTEFRQPQKQANISGVTFFIVLALTSAPCPKRQSMTLVWPFTLDIWSAVNLAKKAHKNYLHIMLTCRVIAGLEKQGQVAFVPYKLHMSWPRRPRRYLSNILCQIYKNARYKIACISLTVKDRVNSSKTFIHRLS